MGFLAELVAAQAKIPHHTTGLSCSPATVALAIGGAVPWKLLQLEVNLKLFHRILCCYKGSLKGLPLGPEALCQLSPLHITGNHRLFCHQNRWWYDGSLTDSGSQPGCCVAGYLLLFT